MSRFVVAALLVICLALAGGTAHAQTALVTGTIPAGSSAIVVTDSIYACDPIFYWEDGIVGDTEFKVGYNRCPGTFGCHPCETMNFSVPGGITTVSYAFQLEISYSTATNHFTTRFKLTPPGGSLVNISDTGPVTFGQIVVNSTHNLVPGDCPPSISAGFVPALGPWGAAVLALAMLGLGVLLILRRSRFRTI